MPDLICILHAVRTMRMILVNWRSISHGAKVVAHGEFEPSIEMFPQGFVSLLESLSPSKIIFFVEQSDEVHFSTDIKHKYITCTNSTAALRSYILRISTFSSLRRPRELIVMDRSLHLKHLLRRADNWKIILWTWQSQLLEKPQVKVRFFDGERNEICGIMPRLTRAEKIVQPANRSILSPAAEEEESCRVAA